MQQMTVLTDINHIEGIHSLSASALNNVDNEDSGVLQGKHDLEAAL